MRQLSTKLMLVLTVMLPLFYYGCGNDDDGVDLLPPTIETTAGDPASVVVGATTTITYTVTTPGGYQTATASTNDADIATASVSTPGRAGQETSTVVVTVTGVAAGSTNVTLEVEDQQDQNASDDVAVTVTAPPTEPDPDTEDPTTVATASAALDTIAELSTLNAAVDAIDGLGATLDGAEQITIFAPNNAAFTELLAGLELEDGDLEGLLDTLTAPGVSSVLQAHVVADSLSSVEVLAAVGDTLQTLNENATLGISQEGETLLVNGAAIVQADIFISNGVIHIIDSVVNTSSTTGGSDGDGGDVDPTIATVADTIIAIDDLSSLEDALTAASLVEPLQGEGPFTVFAPNNEAFTALLADQEVDDLAGLVEKLGLPAVTSILQAHVVAQSLSADELEDQEYATLNTDQTITVTRDADGNVLIDGAAVVSSDIIAGNGVVHIIDAVINVPTPDVDGTVVDAIASRGTLSNLSAALERTSNVTTTLQGEGPFTVFAPSDVAFQALLGERTLDQLISDLGDGNATAGTQALGNILRGHVVTEELDANQLTDGREFGTVGGTTLAITVEDGITRVNGATVVEKNLRASNGVVHIINQVLVADTDGGEDAATVVDIVTERDDLSSLEAAIGATGTELAETLQGDGQFTLFAPDNDAFTALLDGRTLEQLVEDLGGANVLADILQAHVILSDQALTSDLLVDSRRYESVDGATLTVEISGSTITVNGAEITTPDLRADNGVVHIIDEVVNTSAGNTGENGFTVTIENVSSSKRFFQHGTFAGPIAPGGTNEFQFYAGPQILPDGPSPRLSLITMLAASNDLFLATGQDGIELYPGGTAITGNITEQMAIWDAGTENDEGEDEDGVVSLYTGGDFLPADELVTVNISNEGALFTVRITNNGQTPLSPGVFGIHTVNTPLFKNGEAST